MRVRLTEKDLIPAGSGTKSIPVENVGDIICQFKAAVDALNPALAKLIEEVQGLRKDVRDAMAKTDEGLESARESRDSLEKFLEEFKTIA